MSIANERKWRLMTHKELEHGYKNCDNNYHDSYPTHAYITYASESDSDPLYSIDVCDGNNEEENTLLALEIIVHLNYEDC